MDGKLQLVSYLPNKIIFNTKTKDNYLLFLSDVYYPGWSVMVDNNSSDIYRANYAFRAIYLPKGTHQVVFGYRSTYFRWGLIMTIISSMTILLIVVRWQQIVKKF